MSASPVPRAIVFDLDGTLTQSREPAWRLFEHVNRRLGLGIDDEDRFFALFRDNLYEGLERVAGPKFGEAVTQFEELLRADYNPEFVPGMVDVVKSLAPHFALCVMSSNVVDVVRRVLDGAGLATCFAHVFTGDVEPKKAKSLVRFLSDPAYTQRRMCNPVYHDSAPILPIRPEETYLVTDTTGDIAEAASVGVRSVGVTWGMHDRGELEAAGAEFVALWPQELTAFFRSRLPQGTELTSCVLPCDTGSCEAFGTAVAIPDPGTAESADPDAGDAWAAVRRLSGSRSRGAGTRQAATADVLASATQSTLVPRSRDVSVSDSLRDAIARLMR